MNELTDLPPWTEWDDHTRMSIIAMYRHWFLFNDNGKPKVIKRRKLVDRKAVPVIESCDEEVCDLHGEGKEMTSDARAHLRIAWGEYTGWREVNK